MKFKVCLSVYKIGIFFTLLFFTISCKKPLNIQSTVSTNFGHKILDGYFVTTIAFDHLGNAWIGTFKQGLIRYKNGVTTVFNSRNSAVTDTVVINDIEIDSKNNVWIGANALIKYDGAGFTTYNNTNSPMPENYVSSIAIDSKDNIWFSSSRFRTGGLVKYDGSRWNVYTPLNSTMPGSMIADIAIDKNDKVWVALNDGVFSTSMVSIQDNNWKNYTSVELGFSPYYFGHIDVNSQNNVIGSIDYSLSSSFVNNRPILFMYNGITSLTSTENQSGLRPSLKVDKTDNIWLNTGNTVSIYNGVSLQKIDSFAIPSSIFTIAQAPAGTMWIGTGDGVYTN